MKIHEYNEMMAYLTRPAAPIRQPVVQGGVIGKGGMFQGEDMGYRTGFKYIKKGYPESKFTNYADRNPGFEEFLKENNMSVEDFKKSYTKRDIIGKFERTQIPKKYITTSDLSKLLVEKEFDPKVLNPKTGKQSKSEKAVIPTGPLFETLNAISTEFGVDPLRILAKQDLNGAQRKAAQEYIFRK